MARKVFISVLGTGLYGKCKYVSDGFTSSETAFIQQATLEYHKAKDWDANSKIFILTTQKAKEMNWNKDISFREAPVTKEKKPYTGLERILEDAGLPVKAEAIDIPDGKDNDEMWKIFDTLFGLIQNEDELYFDLTHSFRYIPMLVLVFGNYAKFLKKAKVNAITYGNFEARDYKTNEAPIVDLLPLSSLQDWTIASADYVNNGYVERLVKMTGEELKPILKEARGSNANASNLSNFNKSLGVLVDERLMCRGNDVIKSGTLSFLSQKIGEMSNIVIKPLAPVIEKIGQSFAEFNKDADIANTFSAAKWCYENGLYQQATTFLEEGVISYFCMRHAIELSNEKKRGLVTSAFKIKIDNIPREGQRVEEESYRPILDELLKDQILCDKDIINWANELIGLRNDYNHCGMRDNAFGSDKMKKKIGKLLNNFSGRLYGEEKTGGMPVPTPLFVNLSNHPAENWSEEQREAASRYGEIKDMEFPAIRPEADEKEIEEVVSAYENEILDLADTHDLTVHVMGEMTFVFMLVNRLKSKGIRCVASTTKRIVEEHDDRKTSTFRFVKFRSY